VAQIQMVKCQKCGREISRRDSFTHGGQILCEDCYLEAAHRVQICDPLAVRSAKQFRKASGLQSTEGLTELQRAICEFIKSKGKASVEELFTTFHLSPQELENQIAILRHCDLVKGKKEGNKVYLTPF
jgi:late competence protein required for DNA uptake (superfamily II DNA/RNA helicase)